MSVLSFFDIDNCYARLDHYGDPLENLTKVVDWRGLSVLMGTIQFEGGGTKGRVPMNGLMMAKIMILQSYYNLADDACEFMINDRLSFKRFLGLELVDKSPDSKTIWLWRERIKHSALDRKIFEWFQDALAKASYCGSKGQIIDATFVPTHKPMGKHKKQLSEGIPLTTDQNRQRDCDATFTKKGGKTYHGYKNHIVVDREHKLIRSFDVTTASTHDSQVFMDLLSPPGENWTEEDVCVWADSAYRSEEAESALAMGKLSSRVHERAYRNRPLTEGQKAENRERSRARARVEHVFGHVTTAMGGFGIHTLSLARARVKTMFKNLAYNLQRFVFLEKRRRHKSYA